MPIIGVLLVVLLGLYCAAGVVVALVAAASDSPSIRKGVAGVLGEVAGFHVVGLILLVALWPVLLLQLLSPKGDDIPKQGVVPPGACERSSLSEKRPNKAPEPTPVAVTPRATEGNPK